MATTVEVQEEQAAGSEVRCHIVMPPEEPAIHGKSVFLAGSIDMGSAVEWQT
jgi:hypothetical protein